MPADVTPVSSVQDTVVIEDCVDEPTVEVPQAPTMTQQDGDSVINLQPRSQTKGMGFLCEVPVVTLYDSGSTISLVRRPLALKLVEHGIIKLLPSRYQASAANGGQLNLVGRIDPFSSWTGYGLPC